MIRVLVLIEIVLSGLLAVIVIRYTPAAARRRHLLVIGLVLTATLGSTAVYRSARNARLLASSSYACVITDHELFLFAVAADVGTWQNSVRSGASPLVTDVMRAALTVLRDRTVPTAQNGWLFQPGYWSDHPDYLFAGHTEKREDMVPFPMQHVAEDSSHSHRWPLWLESLRSFYPVNSEPHRYITDLREGLHRQFFSQVLIPPTLAFRGYRTTNYMDGWNGVYRWGYETLGKSRGYGPYQLSGTLLAGWWTFLDSPAIRNVYSDVADQFPLSDEMRALYLGPDTARDRHELYRSTAPLDNGYLWLSSWLASRLSIEDHSSLLGAATPRILKTWDLTVARHLSDPLWRQRDAADAAFFLMVPLHAAFLLGPEEWRRDFAEHFARFARFGISELADYGIDRDEYLYLCSRFIVLAQRAGYGSLIPPDLVRFLERDLEDRWRRHPELHWFRRPFRGGLSEAVNWKLQTCGKLQTPTTMWP